METNELVQMAKRLDQARLDAKEMDRISTKYPKLMLEDAYRIQDAGIDLRLGRGEKIIGYKVGLTSEAKRAQMGLRSPIYGVLTDQMQIQSGAPFSLCGTIHPKIEPEIAFKTKKSLRGPITFWQALDACESVCAAMEILDSRYIGFKYFSLQDVVADNSSSAFFILGPPMALSDSVNLNYLQMVMEVNGQKVQSACSSAISGHPVHSLIQLCEILNSQGRELPAGSIVLTGAAAQALALEPRLEIKLRVEKLGAVSVAVVNSV